MNFRGLHSQGATSQLFRGFLAPSWCAHCRPLRSGSGSPGARSWGWMLGEQCAGQVKVSEGFRRVGGVRAKGKGSPLPAGGRRRGE